MTIMDVINGLLLWVALSFAFGIVWGLLHWKDGDK